MDPFSSSQQHGLSPFYLWEYFPPLSLNRSLFLRNNMNDEADCRLHLPLDVQATRFTYLLLVAFLYLATALNITTLRMPDPATEKELPDLGFQLVPQAPQLEHVTDAILWTLNAMCGFVLFKLYVIHRRACGLPPLVLPIVGVLGTDTDEAVISNSFETRQIHLIAWIRFVATLAVVTLFRVVVILATSLPATDNDCQHPEPISNPLLNIVLALVTAGSASIHCGDLLYSGHTVNITLSLISLWTYAPVVFVSKSMMQLFRSLGVILMVSSWYTIIASRSHYSDDVIVALYVTLTAFWLIPHSEAGAPAALQLIIRRLGFCCCCRGRQSPVEAHGVNGEGSHRATEA